MTLRQSETNPLAGFVNGVLRTNRLPFRWDQMSDLPIAEQAKCAMVSAIKHTPAAFILSSQDGGTLYCSS